MKTLYEAVALACGVMAATIWIDHPELAIWSKALITALGAMGYVGFIHLATIHLAQQKKKEQRARRHHR